MSGKRKIAGIILSGIAVLFFLGLFLSSRERSQKPVNVILIVVDALRPDHLGCYGYDRPTSPHIDAFARQGVVFDKAFSSGTATEISVPSLLSSLYPAAHRVLDWDYPFSKKIITLPEILAQKGYRTAAFVGPTVRRVPDFCKRFQDCDFTPEKAKQRLGEIPVFKPGLKPLTPTLIGKALAWLKSNSRRPFFLYIHDIGVHMPYMAPAPFNTLFWKGAIGPENEKFLLDFVRVMVENRASSVTAQQLDFLVSQYDAKIRFVDEYLGTLFREMERLGLTQDTLVILTADHGEALSEHGVFGHGRSPYDELLRVPLIIRLPKKSAEGRRVSDLVRLVDIEPTVLECLKIHSPYPVQGLSLRPLWKPHLSGDREAFGEGYQAYLSLHFAAVRTGRWKFIEAHNTFTRSYIFELYDLENDPKELTNLAVRHSHDKEVGFFKKKLKSYLSGCEKIRKALLGEEADAVRKPQAPDKETEDLFRSLGYLQ